LGYIDSDTHVREPEASWDYLDPAERHYRPAQNDQGVWVIGGIPRQRPFDVGAMPPEYNRLFPVGSVDLADPTARLERLDALGIDAQVLFSSFWLNAEIASADEEAALMRSWNRWMADRVSNTNGRLLWTLEVPFRAPERALAEMEFGKEHGATGVHLSGLRHGATVANPLYRPIYEKAQDLDLVVAIHVGGDSRIFSDDRSIVFINNLSPVPGALYALYRMGVPAEFPQLKWAFVEAGASWLPFAVQEASRADQGGNRIARDWRDLAGNVLAEGNFFVTCQIDDDLPYLCGLFGADHLVHGTDYSHMDLGSDPYGHHIIAARTDLAPADAGAIVDSNARRLWGIDPSFTPAPIPEARPDVIAADKAWIN
jgi:predicted TIM-barrel fold metal-dependent hydrolase